MCSISKSSLAIIAILLVAFLPHLVDVDKPYETWDEITTYAVGLNMWYNVAKLDFSEESWSASPHPPLARLTYGVVNGVYLFSKLGTGLMGMGYDEAVNSMFTLKNLGPGRLLSAFFALLTVALTFFLTKELFNTRVAVLSAALLSLAPVFLAQTRLAALDSLLLFLFTLAVFLFLKGLNSKKYFYAACVVTGLAITTKFNAFTLFFLLPLIWFFYKKRKPADAVSLWPLPVISFATLVVLWPRLWANPVANFIDAVNYFGPSYSLVSEYFLGTFDKPVYYMAAYLFATAPALLLAFFVLGVVVALRKHDFKHNVFLLWFFVPLIIYSLFTFKQAGPRYVFMVYPALAILASLGVFYVANGLKKLPKFVVPGLMIAYMLLTVLAVHPFYLDYYSEAVGGPGSVYENKMFAVGQWGEGIGAATLYLNAHAEKGASVQLFVMPRHVIPPLREDLNDLTPFIPKYLSETGEMQNWYMNSTEPTADYVVENTFYEWYIDPGFKQELEENYVPVHTVEVQGAVLSQVFKRKGL